MHNKVGGWEEEHLYTSYTMMEECENLIHNIFQDMTNYSVNFSPYRHQKPRVLGTPNMNIGLIFVVEINM